MPRSARACGQASSKGLAQIRVSVLGSLSGVGRLGSVDRGNAILKFKHERGVCPIQAAMELSLDDPLKRLYDLASELWQQPIAGAGEGADSGDPGEPETSLGDTVSNASAKPQGRARPVPQYPKAFNAMLIPSFSFSLGKAISQPCAGEGVRGK